MIDSMGFRIFVSSLNRKHRIAECRAIEEQSKEEGLFSVLGCCRSAKAGPTVIFVEPNGSLVPTLLVLTAGLGWMEYDFTN